MESEQMSKRCKYCRAGNLLLKSGWHELEVYEGHMLHGAFCDDLIDRAADDMKKATDTKTDRQYTPGQENAPNPPRYY